MKVPAPLQNTDLLWQGHLSPLSWNKTNSTSALISASVHDPGPWAEVESRVEIWVAWESSRKVKWRLGSEFSCNGSFCTRSRRAVRLEGLRGVWWVGVPLGRFKRALSFWSSGSMIQPKLLTQRVDLGCGGVCVTLWSTWCNYFICATSSEFWR